MKNYIQIGADEFRAVVSEKDNIYDADLSMTDCGLAVVTDDEGNFRGILTPADISKKTTNLMDIAHVFVSDVYNRNPKTISVEELDRHNTAGTNPFQGCSYRSMIVLDGQSFHSVILQFVLHLDIADACNLHCPCCLRGKGEMKNSQNKMSLEEFKQIVEKAADFGFDCIHLYNWTEPFLCDDFNSYLKLAESRGLTTHFSTNLSLNTIPNLKEILYMGKGTIMVSVSGFTQEVHRIYHRGGDIETVKKHLQYISSCYENSAFARGILVKFIDFGYNSHEISAFEEWIKNLSGISFTVNKGMGDPLGKNTNCDDTGERQKSCGDISINGEKCDYFKTITVDCNGDVYLCCQLPYKEKFKIGNLLSDDSIEDIILAKRESTVCHNCKLLKDYYSVR